MLGGEVGHLDRCARHSSSFCAAFVREVYGVAMGLDREEMARTQVRLLVAILCGIAGAHFAFVNASSGRAASRLGTDPRRVPCDSRRTGALCARRTGSGLQWPAPLVYPLPAAVLTLPLASLSDALAVAVFAAHRRGRTRLGAHARAVGATLGHSQYCCFFRLRGRAVVSAPSGDHGVARARNCSGRQTHHRRCVVHRSAAATGPVVSGLSLIAVTFAFEPLWFVHWRDALARNAAIIPQLLRTTRPSRSPADSFALLCLLRWRRPEGRLVAALACVPQTLLLYETVPLLLVPRRWWQAAMIVAASWALWWWFRTYPPPGLYHARLRVMGTAIVWGLYCPSTLMVLARPNEGALPAWIERRIAAWPRWLPREPAGGVLSWLSPSP